MVFDSCSSGQHDKILFCVCATATSVSSVPPTVSLEFLRPPPVAVSASCLCAAPGRWHRFTVISFCHLAAFLPSFHRLPPATRATVLSALGGSPATATGHAGSGRATATRVGRANATTSPPERCLQPPKKAAPVAAGRCTLPPSGPRAPTHYLM